jgi:hypothetical protein
LASRPSNVPCILRYGYRPADPRLRLSVFWGSRHFHWRATCRKARSMPDATTQSDPTAESGHVMPRPGRRNICAVNGLRRQSSSLANFRRSPTAGNEPCDSRHRADNLSMPSVQIVRQASHNAAIEHRVSPLRRTRYATTKDIATNCPDHCDKLVPSTGKQTDVRHTRLG